MKDIDKRTMATLEIVLEEVCRSLPHGGDHELRKRIAEKLLDSAIEGHRTSAELTDVARATLAEAKEIGVRFLTTNEQGN